MVQPLSDSKRNLLRPLPTYLLVGASVIAVASCVAHSDEPLASSDPALEAPASEPSVSDVPAVRLLESAFPAHANRVLGRLHDRGFVSVDRGFSRGPSDSLVMHLDVELPQDAKEAVRLTAPGGYEIRVRQLGVESEGVLSEHVVTYRRARGTSFWTVTGGGAEEWLHFERGAVTSDADVAAEWEIDGATPVLMDNAVALVDDEGVARAWVTAPEAFASGGRNVDLRLSVEGNRIELHADARGEEVLLDPGWVAVAPVAIGRWGATATTMANGQVLYANGFNGMTLPNATQIYNPAMNMWTAGANIGTSRYYPGATLLSTGRVFVFGGQTLMGYTNTTERYDPGTNTWSAGPTMSVARGLPIYATLTNNRVLVAGGYDGAAFVTSAQLYDPVANTWSAAGNMATARGFGMAARMADGRILVAGGINGIINTPTVLGSAEIYNPTTNTWSSAGSMATPRYLAGVSLLSNGRVLVAGGFDATGNGNGTAELYDPTTNSWSATGALPAPAGAQAGVLLGTGRFLSAGGFGTVPIASSATYDPASGMWTNTGDMSAARGLPASVALANGDALVVSGTADQMTGSTEVDRYVASNLAAGAACTLATQCATGFCVDGVCCQVAVCTASDQCHNPGTCQAGTGLCSNPNKPNNTLCNDNNACTLTDTCQAGVCSGANPVMCSALSQCHDVGTCDSATGMCTNPLKADNTPCNDSNACTQVDTCQAGMCSGASPVVCMAMDQCHDVGTCDSATGVCSNPAKADGAVCDDADACTQTDTCQTGACMGANPVVCAASDQCHDVGTCDSATGMCSDPVKADGTGCDDSDLCTQMDSCQAGTCTGADPVTCTALDQCHDVGTCDPATGVCSDPALADGASCDDGDACTQTDTCQAGACAGAMPVTCTAQDECHDVGTCETATGTCSNPAKADGAPCTGGTCQGGTCKLDGAGGAGGGGGGSAGAGGEGGSPNAGGSGGGVTTDPGSCDCNVIASEKGDTSSSALAGLALAAMTMLRRRRSEKR